MRALVERRACFCVRLFTNSFSCQETKIWRAAFQPGSHVVASCGGSYVCLIDCDAGKVLLKYKLLDEDFYSVAWSNMKVAGRTHCGLEQTKIET